MGLNFKIPLGIVVMIWWLCCVWQHCVLFLSSLLYLISYLLLYSYHCYYNWNYYCHCWRCRLPLYYTVRLLENYVLDDRGMYKTNDKKKNLENSVYNSCFDNQIQKTENQKYLMDVKNYKDLVVCFIIFF